jgi:hypothetical protein
MWHFNPDIAAQLVRDRHDQLRREAVNHRARRQLVRRRSRQRSWRRRLHLVQPRPA